MDILIHHSRTSEPQAELQIKNINLEDSSEIGLGMGSRSLGELVSKAGTIGV